MIDQTVVFRVDASNQIGTGHVMRCLTLADSLRSSGAKCIFLSRAFAGNLIDFIQAEGHEVISLPLPEADQTCFVGEPVHSSWRGVSWKLDAQQSKEALTGLSIDWLVVDHYGLWKPWETELRTICTKILVIDDLADREHDCDFLVDQNITASKSRYAQLVPHSCYMALGLRFALLRPEFAQRNGSVSVVSENPRIFLCFGGADTNAYTCRLVVILSAEKYRHLPLEVVVGANFRHSEQLNGLAKLRGDARVHQDVNNVASIMLKCSFAIGAGGVMTWERMNLGLPTILFGIADNQCELINHLLDLNMAIGNADIAKLSDSEIRVLIDVFVENVDMRTEFSEAGMKLVDGRGVERIAEKMGVKRIEFRSVTMMDAEAILQWRNSPEVASNSKIAAKIELPTHLEWVERTISDPSKVFQIALIGSDPVGVVRFDCEGDRALISIYKVPGGPRMKGFVNAACEWFFRNNSFANKIIAEILGDNEASVKAHESAGFINFGEYFQLNRTRD